MAAENVYMGTRNGLLALVPPEKSDEIVWPAGTRFRQCEKAPSGHWILVTSHWDKLHKASGNQASCVNKPGDQDNSPAKPNAQMSAPPGLTQQ